MMDDGRAAPQVGGGGLGGGDDGIHAGDQARVIQVC